MGKVFAGASMSLDGYIAGPGQTGYEHLFRWMGEGDVTVTTAQPEMTFTTTAPSAKHVQEMMDLCGALVCGRGVYEQTQGWGGTHPMGVPVVVMTHRPPGDWPRGGTPFTFVTDGIESAIATAKAIAGDKAVGVNGGVVAQQCLNAGLLDEIWIDLVPVLLGGGTPFLDQLEGTPLVLDGPYSVVEGDGVTHLRYRVR